MNLECGELYIISYSRLIWQQVHVQCSETFTRVSSRSIYKSLSWIVTYVLLGNQ